MPVLVFLGLGRFLGVGRSAVPADASEFATMILPVLGSLLIAVGAVQSLVTIISIYREGGILKRLRATPLRPVTILSAQVVVKLLLTVVTMTVMIAAGRRYMPAGANVPLAGFTLALLLSTMAILSVGFVIASVVPTARFAQPIASLVFYPMIALAMIPNAALPAALRIVARLLPLTYGVSLMRGIIAGEAWSAHLVDVLGIAIISGVCTVVSGKIFRWE